MTTIIQRPYESDDHEEQSPRPELTGLTRDRPHDPEAEQAVLGAMILSADMRRDPEITGLKDQMFYEPRNAIIFRTICEMDAAGDRIDPITVADELARRGTIERVGGHWYVQQLVTAVPTAANGPYYATIVREQAAWRFIIESGTRAVESGYRAEGAPLDAVAYAMEEFASIADASVPGEKERVTAAEAFEDAIDHVQAIESGTQETGLSTGFADLDSLTRGLMPGQFVIIAARPATGKSVLAMDLTRAAAREGKRAVFFSLEMSIPELTLRLMSAQARVALHHLKSGQMTDDDWLRVERHAGDIATDRIVMVEKGCETLSQVRAHCLDLARGGDLGLVVIDYLQLMEGSGHRSENRQQEVSKLSRGLKLLAKELKVPIVALSQLNRGPEQRQDKKPMVSDLRESGSIEQDADVVILLHREDAYEKESPRAGEADLIVAKHRNGPTATITVAFQGHYSRFVNMEAYE